MTRPFPHHAMPDLTGVTVVFDLDGTLVDTAPDLCKALNHVLAQNGHKPIALPTVRQIVGRGARALIARGFAETGEDVPEARMDALTEDFVAFYRDHIADESRPFPGVVDVLQRLKDMGARLGVCTNKRQVPSDELLQALKIDHFFDAVVGADSVESRKPDPAHILATIERAGGTPERAIMIGDSPPDVDAAKAAGVPVIAVTFGYTEVPVGELGADRVEETYEQVWSALLDLASRLPAR